MQNQEEQTKVPPKAGRIASVQLLASLALLGASLAARAFFPEETRAFLRKYIAGGWDYTAVMSTVGDNVRSFVKGVPHPNENRNPDAPGAEPPEDTFDPEHEPPPEEDAVFSEASV